MNKYNDIVKRDMVWGTYLLFYFYFLRRGGGGFKTFRLRPNNIFHLKCSMDTQYQLQTLTFCRITGFATMQYEILASVYSYRYSTSIPLSVTSFPQAYFAFIS